MDSAHAALRTYELLEAILLLLPRKDITRVMRVCKDWRKMIHDSCRLEEARVLRHLPSTRTMHGITHVTDTWTPHYPVTAGMRLNPVFGSDTDYIESGGVCKLRLFVYPPYVAKLQAASEEFATFPPCTTIILQTSGSSRACTVYVRAGIRTRDLLDCAKMLCRSKDEDGEGERWGSRSSFMAHDVIGTLVGGHTAGSGRQG